MTTPGALTLAAMDGSRYPSWRAGLVVAYAADKVAAGAWPAADAERLAVESMQQLLPDGVETATHHLFCGLDADGAEVGTVWVHLDATRPERTTAFLYDIVVGPERRGQGWGRALLVATEAWCASQGAAELDLHVFARNEVAFGLYRSAGYEVTDYSMRKPLSR